MSSKRWRTIQLILTIAFAVLSIGELVLYALDPPRSVANLVLGVAYAAVALGMGVVLKFVGRKAKVVRERNA